MRYGIKAILAALLIGYGAFLHHHTSFVAGGSDSSGYLNSARLMLEGRIARPVKALDLLGLDDSYRGVFIPLGFIPGQEPGMMVPSYPPGLPLHMAAATLVGGWSAAPFLIAPIAALGCLILLGLLGRELGLPWPYRFGVATILAAYPVFVFQAVQAMSDVPATFWAMASVLAALRSNHRPGWAAAAGAALGIAVLVRPTNALLVVPLLFALRLTPKAIIRFFLGTLPFALFFLLYNHTAYGNALQSGGYGGLFAGGGMALDYFPARFHHYSYWLIALLTPLVPLGWLAISLDRLVPLRTRALLVVWFTAFLLFYCFYISYETWWYARFLLPGIAAMLLAAALVTYHTVRPAGEQTFASATVDARRLARAVPALLLATVLWTEITFITENRVHKIYKGERVYPGACTMAEQMIVAKGIVASMQFSGALLYYTDLLFARWDYLTPETWSVVRRQGEKRGYHWYALLAPFEMEDLKRRMPGEWREIGTVRDVALWELVDRNSLPPKRFAIR